MMFDVIETPGPDGESGGILEVLGIRPQNGVPHKDNPRKLRIPAKSTLDAEIALLSPADEATDRRKVSTGATITAEDPDGRMQYTQDPLLVSITNPRAASNWAQTRDRGPQGNAKRCVELSEVLETNGHTDTFAKIWQQTNLNESLPLGAEYTVLAPTDDAFDQLAAALNIKKKELMKSPSLDLLLLHHVLPKRVSVDELAAVDSIQTVTCDEIEVGMEDMAVTVSGCAISASDIEVCNVNLYKLNCVLPPPIMEPGEDLCLPRAPTAEIISGNSHSDPPFLDDYDYDYDFDMPPNFQDDRTSQKRYGVVAATDGPENGRTARGTGAPESWTWHALETRVPPKRVPDKWTRLNHLANAGEEPVKATFLPPGWKDWITPGDSSCPKSDISRSECSQVNINGQSCDGANMLHTCGYLKSSGPKSYEIQPPPGSFRDGFINLGDTYVWQSVEGGSSYCTPATEDGSSFKGSVYHEAWVEPRGKNTDLDAMLFLLQNPLNGSPWHVVSMQTAATPGTKNVKRLRTVGQGCFLWVVASASGSGAYDFHLSVSEKL